MAYPWKMVCYCSKKEKILMYNMNGICFQIEWGLLGLQHLFPLETFKYTLFHGELHRCMCFWVHTYWSANCYCLEQLTKSAQLRQNKDKMYFSCPTSKVQYEPSFPLFNALLVLYEKGCPAREKIAHRKNNGFTIHQILSNIFFFSLIFYSYSNLCC